MKYSIIVCSYKNIKHTRKCIDSLIPYLTKDVECILIDDGSNNEMQKLLIHYSNKYRAIQSIIHSENKGLIVRRNEGIIRAKGDYILFIDNDTEWKGNVLSYLSKQIETYPSCGIVGMCGVLMPDIQTSIHIHQSHLTQSIPVQAVTGYCFMIKRVLIKKGLVFDTSMKYMIHEDIDFCFEAGARGYSIYAIANVPLIHHEHGTLQYYKSSQHTIFSYNWNYFVQKWKNYKEFNATKTSLVLEPMITQGKKLIKSSEINSGIFFDLI